MKSKIFNFALPAIVFVIAVAMNVAVNAQDKAKPEVLAQAEAAKIVPSSFYFAGQSAPTQMRNSAVARIGKDRYVIAGLVDTSGYSTEISGKYEGFFITDSAITLSGKSLASGAYGFGFSPDGKLNIFDLSSKQLMSVDTVGDKEMKRPRPLMMSVGADGLRFYKGKNYATIAAN